MRLRVAEYAYSAPYSALSMLSAASAQRGELDAARVCSECAIAAFIARDERGAIRAI